MLTVRRFNELVNMTQEGKVDLIHAIKIAEHESTMNQIKENAELLKIVYDCANFFNQHAIDESSELQNRCNQMIEKIKKEREENDRLFEKQFSMPKMKQPKKFKL